MLSKQFQFFSLIHGLSKYIYMLHVFLKHLANFHSKKRLPLEKNISLNVCPWSRVFGIFFIFVFLPQINSKTDAQQSILKTKFYKELSVSSKAPNISQVPLKSRGGCRVLGGTGPPKPRRSPCNNNSFSLNSPPNEFIFQTMYHIDSIFFSIQNPISFIGTLGNKICMVKIPFLLDWVHRTHQPDMIVRGKGGSVGLLQYEDLSTQNLALV